jgi:hypothetical protein
VLASVIGSTFARCNPTTITWRSILGDLSTGKGLLVTEKEDEKGWGTGYLYKDPNYTPGDHPIERDEVTWHHLWAPPANGDAAEEPDR